ncbi:S1C family serine protease [Clostridium senegalense]|uniref:S1C family serine protease n=2 Tax=Clostridium senegalense TaxID=1465809 RepID=UPI001C11B2F3|nr:S1C family serine protease [Clostridium senegalense]MBU5226504.1 S1C family serine protease [Clostridium senegalense]
MDNNKLGFDSQIYTSSDIRFQKAKNKKKHIYKKITNMIIYILIASLSGAITSKMVFDYKFENFMNENSLNEEALISPDKKQALQELADMLAKSVVSISKVSSDENSEINSGAGTIISSDGYIVTNQHIINKADDIKVKLYDNKVYYADVIGVDAVLDLAVIKISAEGLTPIAFGDFSKVNNGDEVIAMGNPIATSFKGNYSFGDIKNANQRVSVMDRQTNKPIGYTAIKSSTIISVEDSGSPLCNLKGELIGINNNLLNYSEKGTNESLAISIKESKAIIDVLMKKGDPLKLGLGVSGEKAIAKDKDDGIMGIYVKDVIQDSDAYKVGIRPTDIIMSINNFELKEIEDLNRSIKNCKEGDIVVCKVFKNGQCELINVKLGYYRMI